MTADLPASGHRQLWEDRDPQGRLLASAVLGAAGIEGPLRRFGSDGRPTFEADFHDGRLHGVLRAYDDKGALELEARYRHGLREGLARTFSGGRCVAEQVYVAGLPSGPLTTYDDLGRTTRSASFVDGRLDGVVRDFHEGRLVREAVWRSGALEGEVRDLKQGTGAIEERARYELGMMRPDEIFVQIAEPGAASPLPSAGPTALSAAPANPVRAVR
jgi:antitoxin component YwqK of YwqJK toxin-antitoxin module